MYFKDNLRDAMKPNESELINTDFKIYNVAKQSREKVYFRSQILERPSIGKYWNISGVPILPVSVI